MPGGRVWDQVMVRCYKVLFRPFGTSLAGPPTRHSTVHLKHCSADHSVLTGSSTAPKPPWGRPLQHDHYGVVRCSMTPVESSGAAPAPPPTCCSPPLPRLQSRSPLICNVTNANIQPRLSLALVPFLYNGSVRQAGGGWLQVLGRPSSASLPT